MFVLVMSSQIADGITRLHVTSYRCVYVAASNVTCKDTRSLRTWSLTASDNYLAINCSCLGDWLSLEFAFVYILCESSSFAIITRNIIEVSGADFFLLEICCCSPYSFCFLSRNIRSFRWVIILCEIRAYPIHSSSISLVDGRRSSPNARRLRLP